MALPSLAAAFLALLPLRGPAGPAPRGQNRGDGSNPPNYHSLNKKQPGMPPLTRRDSFAPQLSPGKRCGREVHASGLPRATALASGGEAARPGWLRALAGSNSLQAKH